MADILIEDRVNNLEDLMADLARIVARTSASVDQLSVEMRESRERSEAEMREFKAEMREYRERSEVEMREFKAEMEAFRVEQGDLRREFNRNWGEIANQIGTLAENLVAPNLPRIIREVTPCTADDGLSMAVRVRRAHPAQRGRQQEYDVIVSCGTYALFNETKSQLRPGDVEKLISKLSEVRDFFPEYHAVKIIASLASLYVDPSLVNYASRHGILVLATGDELMDIQNEAGLQLREF